MATAYQCDRCNKLFKCRKPGQMYNVIFSGSKFPKDLCPECGEDLDKWMHQEADFVPKEENKEDVQQNV